jgi:hypothetical protein
MYTGHLIRVSWAGVLSDYFGALNGVKQGGVVSPVLFCIYIDDLLINLSQSGVGCYIGAHFVGAITYADDIVLISPTPFGMRKLLSICDLYASHYDIVFNAEKSKFLVILPSKWRSLCKALNSCIFSIGGNIIENVNSYPHLGHIINSKLDDKEDGLHRRNQFIGQVNNVLCFFSKLDLFVKIRLFKSYCSSIYGCELWSLDSDVIQSFCCTWRSAARRLLGLPYNAHCYLLHFLTVTLPIFDEICKRSVRFAIACLNSRSHLVREVAWHGIVHRGYSSLLGTNFMFCCRRFGWQFDDLLLGRVSLHNDSFVNFCSQGIDNVQWHVAHIVSELISLREGYFEFDSSNFLSRSDINTMLAVTSSS